MKLHLLLGVLLNVTLCCLGQSASVMPASAVGSADSKEDSSASIDPQRFHERLHISRLSFSVEAANGVVFRTGGVRNTLAQNLLYAQPNFSALRGNCKSLALSGLVGVSPAVAVGIGVRYERIRIDTWEKSGQYPLLDTMGNHIHWGRQDQKYQLDYSRFLIQPSVRFMPFGEMLYVDGGLHVGTVFSQSTAYSFEVENVTGQSELALPRTNYFFPPDTTLNGTSFGKPRLQFGFMLGVGVQIPISEKFTLDLSGHGRMDAGPLTSDNVVREGLVLEANLGVSYSPR